jgi:ubiquinone/menaquinone biosynthesis C-methylase UbiE
MRAGCDVYAVDAQRAAVNEVRRMAAAVSPGSGPDHFIVAPIESMPLPDGFADAVICSAVMHFAQSDEQFDAMLREMWRVLRAGGLFFCRLGSRIGMDFPQVNGRVHRMPDGSEWYLVDETMLMELTRRLGGELVDPLKTTIVQGARCMTTWVLRKSSGPGRCRVPTGESRAR